jgi:cytochrome c-type biogenesis protein
MTLALIAFIAGILTILAPCVLPVLPIIIGGSVVNGNASWKRTAVIVGSLGLAIVAFTLLLKATTALLGVPQFVWQLISGSIILILGIVYLFPELWDNIMLSSGLMLRSQGLLGRAQGSDGYLQPVLTGAALGPVFSSCSPTYAFIVAAVLPVSFLEGTFYLVLYAFGLALALFLLAFAGQRVIAKLGWALNPHGTFRKVVGLLFVLVGVMVLIGGDRVLQSAILESGAYDAIESLEQSFR